MAETLFVGKFEIAESLFMTGSQKSRLHGKTHFHRQTIAVHIS